MKKQRTTKFSTWIFDSFRITPQGQALYRIFCAIYLYFTALPSTGTYAFLGQLPDDFFFAPPGPMMLFNGFLPEPVFLLLHYGLILALICLCIGFATKTASVCTGLLLLILKGFIYSLGKIDHQMLFMTVPLVMAFSGWGQAYSVDAKRNAASHTQQPWVLTLLALIIGFMFFTAGLPKILGGWLNWATHAAEGHYYKGFFVRGRQDLLAPYARSFKGLMWELADYGTVFFEVGFLAAVFSPKSTRIFVAFAALFHFFIMMILNIPFLPNFLAYAAFINWSALDNRLTAIDKKWTNFTANDIPALLFGTLLLCYLIILQWLGKFANFSSDLTVMAVGLVASFALIALIFLGRLVMQAVVDKKG